MLVQIALRDNPRQEDLERHGQVLRRRELILGDARSGKDPGTAISDVTDPTFVRHPIDDERGARQQPLRAQPKRSQSRDFIDLECPIALASGGVQFRFPRGHDPAGGMDAALELAPLDGHVSLDGMAARGTNLDTTDFGVIPQKDISSPAFKEGRAVWSPLYGQHELPLDI